MFLRDAGKGESNKGRVVRISLLAAATITLAIFLPLALDLSEPMTFFLYPFPGVTLVCACACFAVAFGLARIAATKLRPWVVMLAALVIGAGLAGLGIGTDRPIGHFEWAIISPAPASLANLRVEKYPGHDFWCWTYEFDVSDADFAAIIAKHELQDETDKVKELVAALRQIDDRSPAEREKDVESVYPDSRIPERMRTRYHRPAHARFYRNDEIEAIRDMDTGHVFLLHYAGKRAFDKRCQEESRR